MKFSENLLLLFFFSFLSMPVTLQSTDEMEFNGTLLQSGTGSSWPERSLTGTFVASGDLDALNCNGGTAVRVFCSTDKFEISSSEQ